MALIEKHVGVGMPSASNMHTLTIWSRYMIAHNSTISIARVFLLVTSSMPLFPLYGLPSYFTFGIPPAIVAQLKNELAHEEYEILEEFCSSHAITMEDLALTLCKVREAQNRTPADQPIVMTLSRGNFELTTRILEESLGETEPLSQAQEKKIKDFFHEEGIELNHIISSKKDTGTTVAAAGGNIHDPVLLIYPIFWKLCSPLQRITLRHELTHVRHEDHTKNTALNQLHSFFKFEKKFYATHPHELPLSEGPLSISIHESTNDKDSLGADALIAETEIETIEEKATENDSELLSNGKHAKYAPFSEKRAEIEAMLASNRMEAYGYLFWRKPSTDNAYGPLPENLTLAIERYTAMEDAMKKVNKAVRQELGQYCTDAVTQPLNALSSLFAVTDAHKSSE